MVITSVLSAGSEPRQAGRIKGRGHPLGGANGTWVTLYYQDMGYSLCCWAAGFLPPGNV
jgi:hypothetical protein